MLENIKTYHRRILYFHFDNIFEAEKKWMSQLFEMESWVESHPNYSFYSADVFLYFFSLDREGLLQKPIWLAREIIGPPVPEHCEFKSYDLFKGEASQLTLSIDFSESLVDIIHDGISHLGQTQKLASTARIKLKGDVLDLNKDQRLFPQVALEVFGK